MNHFRHHFGAVYIFENVHAQRVKIGVTTGSVDDRLRDVHDKWRGLKITCQICGGRRLPSRSWLMPKHTVSGRRCAGEDKLPLEKDCGIAKSHLEDLKSELVKSSGSEKSSIVRKINALERRIALYSDYVRPQGRWDICITYRTDCAEQVEKLSHELLAQFLDKDAPIGEVFSCSVGQASNAIESALMRLNLFEGVIKEVRDDDVSKRYGFCPVCGGSLNVRGGCAVCVKRVFGK